MLREINSMLVFGLKSGGTLLQVNIRCSTRLQGPKNSDFGGPVKSVQKCCPILPFLGLFKILQSLFFSLCRTRNNYWTRLCTKIHKISFFIKIDKIQINNFYVIHDVYRGSKNAKLCIGHVVYQKNLQTHKTLICETFSHFWPKKCGL